ncbi:MAG: hypothetical protein Q8M96_17285, partial [Rubrivivax sp.]|nr:hypothetical protein [Rubrivivax sp.]
MKTNPPSVAHAWLKLETDNHTDPVVALAASADGRTVVSAGDCTVRVWDMATGKLRRQLLGHTRARFEGGSGDGMIDGLALSPDGQWVVTLRRHARHGRAEVFNAQTGNLVSAFEGDAETRFQAPAFSPDGQWLALGVTRLHEGGRCEGAVQVIATGQLLHAGFERPPRPAAEQLLVQAAVVDGLPVVDVVPHWIPAPGAPSPPARAQAARRGSPAPALGLVVATRVYADPPQCRLLWLAFRPGQGLERVRSTEPAEPIFPRTMAVSARMVAVRAGTAEDDTGHAAEADGLKRPGLGRLIALDHRSRTLGEAWVEAPPRALAFSPQGDELAVGLDSHPESGGLHIVLSHVLAIGPEGLVLRSTYYGHDGSV